MKYQVLIMRPVWFLDQIPHMREVQDLTYVAHVEANNEYEAGRLARSEAYRADRKDVIRDHIKENGPLTEDDHNLADMEPDDYTVLCHTVDGGGMVPWYNGTVR